VSTSDRYQLELVSKISDIQSDSWNALIPADSAPFIKHTFLETLESTCCVGEGTGWQVAHLCIYEQNELVGALPLYLKYHSYGEYVFDWSWAQAYEQAGKKYFPKALSAIPFTPVQCAKLLCHPQKNSQEIQELLVKGLKSVLVQNQLSSGHILFPKDHEIETLSNEGFLVRDSVQFHWENHDYQNFDDFLNSLTFKRRKNIRRERQLIAKSGICFKQLSGDEITEDQWRFFYACYQNTYLEHRSSPYLNEAFFIQLGRKFKEHLLLILAEEENQPIAASLIVVDKKNATAFGRYWGAIKHVPLLHFETAYYQVIEYCIREGIQRLEGGAQGEHKMARGFIPTTLHSAHFILDPEFSNAVSRFLDRERLGISAYVDELNEHHPLNKLNQQNDLLI